ncbi:MAG: acyl-ACP--UDP-N-acetylglucosamine O-acyltransferase [Polyangiales bacterium]
MIHSTAIVDDRAKVSASSSIGPYCVVGAHVTIGEGSQLLSHVVVEGPTTLGARVVVHPFAVLGGAPQDRSHAGEATELVVGDDTVIREHATLHRGTRKDRGKTIVGARCLIMVGVHVAHDVIVGDDCTIANACQLAGHCVLEDGVTMGGAAALAPFVRVGEASFVAAGACVEHDVPPFHIAQGDRARVRALNTIGLRRRNVPADSIAALERAHKLIYRSDAPIESSLVTVLAREDDPRVKQLVEFLRAHTTLSATARAGGR